MVAGGLEDRTVSPIMWHTFLEEGDLVNTVRKPETGVLVCGAASSGSDTPGRKLEKMSSP